VATRRRTPVNNSKKARTGRQFTPWAAVTAPPPGTYDPALDAQLGQAGRGYLDLRQDIERDTGRREDDYLRGRNDLTRQFGESQFDLNRARQYQGEDYGRGVAGLERSYLRLGDAQRQQGNAAGVGGGYLAQARRKRAENMAWDRQPLDTQNARALEGFATSEQRLGEGRDRGLGELALGQQRYGEDSQTQLTRGAREFEEFGQDIGAGRFYQAAGTGWAPPPKPANEGTRFGVTYQRNPDGRATLANGRVVSAAGLRNILARARAKNPTAARV
jgi:hypothetical protein